MFDVVIIIVIWIFLKIFRFFSWLYLSDIPLHLHHWDSRHSRHTTIRRQIFQLKWKVRDTWASSIQWFSLLHWYWLWRSQELGWTAQLFSSEPSGQSGTPLQCLQDCKRERQSNIQKSHHAYWLLLTFCPSQHSQVQKLSSLSSGQSILEKVSLQSSQSSLRPIKGLWIIIYIASCGMVRLRYKAGG